MLSFYVEVAVLFSCLSSVCLSLSLQSATLHSLREATGLPYQELCDALLCLTAHRQKILCSSEPSHQSSAPLQDKDFAYVNTSFQLNSVFSINEEFVQNTPEGARFVWLAYVQRQHVQVDLGQ